MEAVRLAQAAVRFGVVPTPLRPHRLTPVPVLMAEAEVIPVEEAVAATGNSLILLG